MSESVRVRLYMYSTWCTSSNSNTNTHARILIYAIWQLFPFSTQIQIQPKIKMHAVQKQEKTNKKKPKVDIH